MWLNHLKQHHLHQVCNHGLITYGSTEFLLQKSWVSKFLHSFNHRNMYLHHQQEPVWCLSDKAGFWHIFRQFGKKEKYWWYFHHFLGFATTTPVGTCSDSLAVKGQTGSNPPSICGTNTGYHSQSGQQSPSQIDSLLTVYAEFGTTSTDTVSVTFTYASTTDAKTFNILTRQIACTATWK